MRFHDDSCLIVAESGEERTLDGGEETVLKLGCVLPKVPDIAFPILSKKIKGILRKFVVCVDRIMHLDASNTINNSGVASHGKDVSDSAVPTEIGKGCTRNERKVRVIYGRREVSRIDNWIVRARAKLLTTRPSHIKPSTAGITRISQIGCGLLLACAPSCRVSDVNAFTNRNLIVASSRRLAGCQGITCGLQANIRRLWHRIFVLRQQVPGKERREREGNGGK